MPRYLRPPFLMARVINPLLMAVGAVPTLATRGRKTGEWRRVPVNVLEVNGVQYLVAPRGDSQWARNALAHPEVELRHRGKTRRLRATPVPDSEKPALVSAYLAKWGGQVRGQFAQLPDPVDHPVFRLAER
jgi:deazaflavin-dependent oxidoreductase (nitroreductase family)